MAATAGFTRAVQAELSKAFSYRTPLAIAAGGVLLSALWDVTLLVRGESAVDARHMLDSSLAFSGVVLPLVWFALPLVLVSGDVVDGTLRPALIAYPKPGRLLAAKWVVAAALGVVVAVGAWAALAAGLALRPDGSQVGSLLLASLPRSMAQSLACVSLAFALHVVTGFRAAPWVLLSLIVWIHLIERVLGSALPGVGTFLLVSPFRVVDFWVRQRWSDPETALLGEWGMAPLGSYVLVISVAVGWLFHSYSDRSGRPWGRKHG